ncbi:MAG: hypothetical protein R2715_22030 [Ilumatobacteraceae bacterium]
MSSEDDVARIVAEFPDVGETTKWRNRTWTTGGAGFAWIRPFSKADVKRFGAEPVPTGEILAVSTDGMDDKAALLETRPDVYFDIEHLAGYPALLVQLESVDETTLQDVLLEAWLAVADEARAKAFLAQRQPGRSNEGG